MSGADLCPPLETSDSLFFGDRSFHVHFSQQSSLKVKKKRTKRTSLSSLDFRKVPKKLFRKTSLAAQKTIACGDECECEDCGTVRGDGTEDIGEEILTEDGTLGPPPIQPSASLLEVDIDADMTVDPAGESPPSSDKTVSKRGSRLSLANSCGGKQTCRSSKENLAGDLNQADGFHSRSSSPKGSRHSDRERKKNGSTSTGRIQTIKNFLAPNYKSRAEEFRRLFRTVPEHEKFVIDYSCAFQREILVHGRMFVSQGSVCFYANIFKWETCLIIKLRDVNAITKEKTAKVIPNAIQVSTVHGEKYFFTSFSSRDKSYMALFKLWQSALLDQVVSPTELWSWAQHGYGTNEELPSPEEEDEEDIDSSSRFDSEILKPKMSLPDGGGGGEGGGGVVGLRPCVSDNRLPNLKESIEHQLLEKAGSSAPQFSLGVSDLERKERRKKKRTKEGRRHRSPRPLSSSPGADELTESSENDTELSCPCSVHEGREFLNMILPLSVDQMFILLFTDSKFFREFQVFRRASDSMLPDWRLDKETGLKKREIRFTLHLNHSMGPKSTVVTERQTCEQHGKSGQVYVIRVEAQNDGIPYADSFQVTSTYCLSRVSANQSRVRAHGDIQFKKNIWGIVRSFIEKNAVVGMQENFRSLETCLQKECERLGLPGAGAQPPSRKRTSSQRRRSSHRDDSVGFRSGPNRTALEDSQNLASKAVESLTKFILAIVLVMLLLNGLLFYKLWSLESSPARQKIPEFSLAELRLLLEKGDLNPEDLMRVRRLHEQEVSSRWQETVHSTLNSLDQVERELKELRRQLEDARLRLSVAPSGPPRPASPEL